MTGWKLHRRRCHDNTGKERDHRGSDLETAVDFLLSDSGGKFFQQLYNTVDSVIVGQFVGKEALSSVGGSAGQIISLVVGFFTGVSTGATVIISQYFGAGKKRR